MPLKNEVDILLKTLRLLAKSQVGHASRKAEDDLAKLAWQALLGAGPIERPFEENNLPKSRLVNAS